ncbi:hypothetical protein F4802DRAFT_194117 [Xylaria palmicola]|nr:hypothetical protein F4802DRAFT_194117 [Xylaria palmicola]
MGARTRRETAWRNLSKGRSIKERCLTVATLAANVPVMGDGGQTRPFSSNFAPPNRGTAHGYERAWWYWCSLAGTSRGIRAFVFSGHIHERRDDPDGTSVSAHRLASSYILRGINVRTYTASLTHIHRRLPYKVCLRIIPTAYLRPGPKWARTRELITWVRVWVGGRQGGHGGIYYFVAIR